MGMEFLLTGQNEDKPGQRVMELTHSLAFRHFVP